MMFFRSLFIASLISATMAGFAEDSCSANPLEWVPEDNTRSPTTRVRCCAGVYGTGRDKDQKYASCDTSSCPNNFNHMKNLNCHNYGSPQHPLKINDPTGKAKGGSAICPYYKTDKAICDVSFYNELNGGLNCRTNENGNGKNYQVHCLGKVKCGSEGVTVPKKGKSDGTDGSGDVDFGVCESGAIAGMDCFYNGASENFKVCDGGASDEELADADEAAKWEDKECHQKFKACENGYRCQGVKCVVDDSAPEPEPQPAPETPSDTDAPTEMPTTSPTALPTKSPTDEPTDSPTASPTDAPTTLSPTVESGHPSASPSTGTPTVSPTDEPTASPTASPTDKPTVSDTIDPTFEPTKSPTEAPVDATDAPTGSPKTPPPVTKPPKTEPPINTPPGSFGDPHVKVWSGETFDFHGSCDLVLLDNPSFRNGVGLSIHIRTKIVTWWSFIETAVVRIGNETLEVAGGNQHKYYLNGVEGDSTTENLLFSEFGFKVVVKQATGHQLKIRIDLLNADAIGLETFKEFVRVNIRNTDPKWKNFEGSTGLMGMYPTGVRFGRDGRTVFTDMNAFGQEWQVRESEPMSFHNVDGPQHPTRCLMPEEASAEQKRRRLGSSMITREDADLACARVGGSDHDACVFDVLATNDKDMAGSY